MRPSHPYRGPEAEPVEAPKPPRSKLPWVLVGAGALHAAVLGAAAFAPAPIEAHAANVSGPTITVLGGHVDEATGDVALSGYHVVAAPHR